MGAEKPAVNRAGGDEAGGGGGGGGGGIGGHRDARKVEKEDAIKREGKTRQLEKTQEHVKGEEEQVVDVLNAGSLPRREQQQAVGTQTKPPPPLPPMSRLQAHAPVAPIQVFPANAAAATSQPRSIPPPLLHPSQASLAGSLNPRGHTNRISLFLFLFHMVIAIAAVCFFSYKAVLGALGDMGLAKQRKERRHFSFWLPPIEGSAVVAIVLAFAWQRALRAWPYATVTFILWFCFLATMSAGVLLLCFSLPATDGLGVALIAFSIGSGLYACWVTRRTRFAGKVLTKSLLPVSRFRDLNSPTYMMLATGFVWISLWCFSVIGALNFHYPPLTILAMVLSLMWTAEVIRNVANLAVSRVIALYYLRGMQSNTKFCFQRVVTRNLGSACLGSLFVPAIEACRILARGLNLLEGEDEFMFSCAHCCLRVMDSIFRYGNSWAFVHIAAYGRGFVEASQSTWELFEKAGMVQLVDADITSSVYFLSGVSSGAVCVIFAASWTFCLHKGYTATVSLLAFFVGYLMTRIGMALPQACVGCYYACYAENPTPRLFDSTIPDRIAYIASDREAAAPTPRFPRRFTTSS